jgi:two-component system response regulator DegU
MLKLKPQQPRQMGVWKLCALKMKLRILVADDNAQFLQMMALILEAEFEVVATAIDGQRALQMIRSCQPDLVVLDLEMPLLNGIDVMRELANDNPSPKAVICSVETDPEIVEAAVAAGAMGYVFKSRIETDLVLAVRAVACGQAFVSPNGRPPFRTY